MFNLPLISVNFITIIPWGKLDSGQPIVLLGVPPQVIIIPADVEPDQGGQGALLLIHLNHFSQTSLGVRLLLWSMINIEYWSDLHQNPLHIGVVDHGDNKGVVAFKQLIIKPRKYQHYNEYLGIIKIYLSWEGWQWASFKKMDKRILKRLNILLNRSILIQRGIID